MKIISNTSGNHLAEIVRIARESDKLYIVSPFLMESFEMFFDAIDGSTVKEIALITILKDNDPDLLQKANSFRSFLSLCQERSLRCSLYIDNILHGKAYLGEKNGVLVQGILSSANFTHSGMNRNHEWGVLFDDEAMLRALLQEVLSACSLPLPEATIKDIVNCIDAYTRTHSVLPKPTIKLPVSSLLALRDTVKLEPSVGTGKTQFAGLILSRLLPDIQRAEY